MKMKRKLKSILLCGLVIAGCIGGSIGAVYATTSQIDVTVKNSSTATSDPWTYKTQKDDGDVYFYVKLLSLSGNDSIRFTSYDTANNQVSPTYIFYSSDINTVRSKKYTLDWDSSSHQYISRSKAGSYYRLYATAPDTTSAVHATGNYTP